MRRRRRWCCSTTTIAARVLLHALTLVSLLLAVHSLDLSNRGLTKITASASGSANATSDAVTFTFATRDGALPSISSADLRLETELVLRNNALVTIPAALFRALQSAKRVDLSNNLKLTTLESNSFVDLPQLVEITCVNTSLAELPALLISNCPKLETVTFNQSLIRTIGPNAIAHLPKLQQVHLSQNNVTLLHANSFANVSTLHTLDLSYNNLTDVPGELFGLAHDWRVLDFTRNNLTDVPPLIATANVSGYISFERNLFFEIKAGVFANAASIRELRLGHNGIFTVNSSPFAGMTSLRKLDLSDNVISVIRPDAFKGLDALTELLLGDNYLKRLKLDVLPPRLERLELQSNLLDLMPDFSTKTGVLRAPHLRVLNLSHNVIWGLETNSQLEPYSGLVHLDLSWNRIENFTAAVLTSIEETIETINLDYNQIASVPSTIFLDMLSNARTTVSLQSNPGISATPDVLGRQICPNGSVYNQTLVHSAAQPDTELYGCIQCRIGYFHDVAAGKCVQCTGRAFADKDGATACQYCPHSSDLDTVRQVCLAFACNGFCWLTVAIAMGLPLVLFSGKLALYTISTTIAKQQRLNLAEQEQMTTWRMEQMMRQLGSATLAAPNAPGGGDVDDDAAANTNAAPGTANYNSGALEPCRIYDLPRETQETVLETLQEHFSLRKHKLRATRAQRRDAADTAELLESVENTGTPGIEPLGANDWDNVEWATFHMHRILSRNYHGEVFLGDYCGAQVVVKRLMTLRFEVRELADAIRDIEVMLTFRHPNITAFLGTMWTEREHLCVISEYVRGGDLHSLLEMESMEHTALGGGGFLPFGADPFSTQPFLTSSTSVDSANSTLSWHATKLQMMRDVCCALAHAHDMGVSHSDLRSRNVLVTETFACKLNDFSPATRGDKYATTSLRLQSDVIDDDETDQFDDELDALNPEGVHLIESETFGAPRSARKRDDLFAPQRSFMLPVLPPEVLLHHSTRHLGSDMYSCGVLLIELWFYRHVSSVSTTPSLQDDAAGGDSLEQSKLLSTIESTSDEPRSASEGGNGTANGASAVDLTVAASSFWSLDRSKAHSAMVHQYMAKLRACAHLEPDETNDRSFGTATTSSSASLSFPSSAMLTEKLLAVIEECLHYDPKKRPTAKMLVKLFQQLVDDASLR